MFSLTAVIDSELVTSGQGLLKLGCDDFLKPGSPTGGEGRPLGPLWTYCKVKGKSRTKKEREGTRETERKETKRSGQKLQKEMEVGRSI